MKNSSFKVLKKVLVISRPRFWLYIAGPFLIGVGASYSGAVGEWNIDIYVRILFLFLYFLTFANFYLYGINDYFDQETDKLNPKKKSKENLISENDKEIIKIGSLLFFLMSAIVFFILENSVSRWLLLVFIFLATFYSAPPFRFKRFPILDSSANFLYVLPGILGFVEFSEAVPVVSIMLGAFLWTFSMHLYSAVPDINFDRSSGIKTTGVLLGREKSLLLCTLFWGIFSFVVIRAGFFDIFGLLSLVYPAIPIIVLLSKEDIVNKVYWAFPYLNGFLGFMSFWYLVLVK